MFHPKKFLRTLGPGVITGASDDDPSGIVTYSQAGARFGYGLLWLSLFTTPLMMTVQEMSARLGLVTRRGLTSLLRRHYSRRVAVWLSLALLAANVLNIGADLSAMAAVTRLLMPVPLVAAIIVFAAVIVVLEVFVTYARYVNILKWLTLSLLTYVAAAFVTSQDWSQIAAATIVPHWPTGGAVWLIITAVLGTTISPYLFFWQASEEVEEERLLAKVEHRWPSHLGRLVRRMRVDTVVGMIFSNLIMFFIIVVTAGTLHRAGITTITTAAEAASALQPIGGTLTFGLFALGIIGTGLLAIPVLAGSAAYAVSEVFAWPEGLSKSYRQAPSFYLVLAAAIVCGAVISLSGLPPITFLIAAAVVNGLLAPIVLWFLLRLANRPEVVGQYRTPPLVAVGGWLTFGLMTLSAGLALIQVFR